MVREIYGRGHRVAVKYGPQRRSQVQVQDVELAELIHASQVLRQQLADRGDLEMWLPGVDGKARPVKTYVVKGCYL